jgi:hypothetical protein
MFEKASRKKLRFDTVKGLVTTEDLWDMPLTRADSFSLDDLAKSLNRALKESEEESFVVKKSSENTILDLKFSIVKHVIKTRLAEIEERENAAATKAKKEKILAIIADKEDDSLKDKSISALKKMVADL